MPVEVDSHRYLFNIKDVVVEDSHEADAFSVAQFMGKSAPSHAIPATTEQSSHSQLSPVPFRYNYIHDLESHWWLSLYVLICGRIKNLFQSRPDINFNECMERHGEVAVNLFCSTAFRLEVILGGDVFKAEIRGLLPQVTTVARELEQVRGVLATRYRTVEKDLGNIRFPVAGETQGLYLSIFKSFGHMVDILENDNLRVTVDSSPSQLQEHMRKALEERAREEAQAEAQRAGAPPQEAQAAEDDTRPGDADEQARSRKRPRLHGLAVGVSADSVPSSLLLSGDLATAVQQRRLAGPSAP